MCTLFILKSTGTLLVANNEDIFLESGYLFTNQRGISKKALLLPPDEPLQWKSQYGSIVFSQSGKEFPSGGMNETGLVVEQTTLRETRYPSSGNEPAIKELQLIQFLLDTCQSVDEALHQILSIHISQSAAAIQYLLVDASGNSAIIEYLDDGMKIFNTGDITLPVLANSTYLESLSFFTSDGQQKPTLYDDYAVNSLDRFCTVARVLLKNEVQNIPTTEYAFSLLEKVKRPDTIWNIVYAPVEKKITVKTRWNQTGIAINLGDFCFSKSTPSQFFDLQEQENDCRPGRFQPYCTEKNRNLIQNFYRNEIVKQILPVDIPDEFIEYLADYPRKMSET